MLCVKSEKRVSNGSVPVFLNVYDLTPFNGYAYWLGLGVYHSGLQVHGVEYAFGAHEQASTGIFEGEPGQCEGFRFRKTIEVGKTAMAAAEVRGVMEELAEEYRGDAYNLITKNCNHFCDHACLILTGNPIPSWVNRLARIGFICNCVLPATLNSTKVRHHNKLEDNSLKLLEGEKKRFAGDSDPGLNSSDSPTSSLSSASPAMLRRGRSRTRRSLRPSSPLIVGSSAS